MGFLDRILGRNQSDNEDFKENIPYMNNSFIKDFEEEKISEELTLEEKQRQSFKEFRPRINSKIKHISAFMMALFMLLIGNLIYFQTVKAPKLKADAENRRNAVQREKVIRGTIYDRNGVALSESVLIDGSYVRKYNAGVYLGNVLGYVSTNYSVTGIERSMDDELSKDYTLSEVIGKTISERLFATSKPAEKKRGNDVTTTIDFELQKFAFEAMKDPETGKYHKGSVVVMDPRTGEILAMVSLPSFDPNKLTEVMNRVQGDQVYASSAPLINRATDSTYPPGSTFKTVTLTAGITNIPGIENKYYNDTGVINFKDGNKIINFQGEVFGKIDMKEAFASSLNTTFATLGMQMSSGDFRKVAEQFGFNQEIQSKGLSLVKSIFPSHSAAEEGLRALSGIGQGEVTSTPIQMAMVASTIANKGVTETPKIIRDVVTADNRSTYSLERKALPNPISAQTARTVGEFMRYNVETSTGSYSVLKDVDGAGKTGTAQFTKNGEDRAHAWFIGFAPYDNPKVAISVIIEDQPDDGLSTGAMKALPIAHEILNYYLNR